MTKTLVERINQKKREEGRALFAGYVQSVAFNMTLSRNMVDMLGVVRDQQNAGHASYSEILTERDAKFRSDTGSKYGRDYVSGHSVPLFNSLIRRGLVIFNHWEPGPERKSAPAGWRYHELTRAGELMCDLLVEAGLLSESCIENKKARR